MKLAIVLAAALAAGCQISPVITDPSSPGSGDLYSDCKRAARDYCEDVKQPETDRGLRTCISKATYRCVSGDSGG